MSGELESRLKNWAYEYGGRDRSIGWPSRNILASVIDHKGFIPDSRGHIPIPIRTAADEIESIVLRMEHDDLFKPGRVLRCDYFMPRIAMEVRLQRLRAIGLPMSRAGYYDYLAQAKAYVAGALSNLRSAKISTCV